MTETIYALYPVFKATPAFRTLGAEEVADATEELEHLFKDWAGRVDVRGSYSTVGFRADADMMLWLVGPKPDDVQEFLVAFNRTRAGRLLGTTFTFMGVVKPAEFTADHAPAFAKGDPPKRFACVYPFVRTPEWYLLPREERSALLTEHGLMGREFPDILANTTSAFGLGDWEWILAFESPKLDSIVDVIRLLRGTEARRFTKEEVPFVTGIRKSIAACIDDLC
jgi:chlorite dismutase